MGSTKLKRKKIRSKGLEKFYKSKANKQKKSVLFESYRKSDCEGNLFEINIPGNRLSPRKRSRFYVREEKVSDVKYFAKVREDYFRYLQTVIYNNCVLLDSPVTDETLESLALELEQNALLACLQVEVYKRSILSIIKDISRSTEEKQVHKDVRKLLSDSSQKETKKFTANSKQVEMYNRIPTLECSRANLKVNNFCMKKSLNNKEPYYLVTNVCEAPYSEDQNDPQINSNIQSGGKDEISLTLTQPSNCDYKSPQGSKPYCKAYENVISSHSPILENTFYDLYFENNDLSSVPSQNEKIHKEVDSLILPRNQLQKLVEQTLNETEKVHRQKQDEHERACIAQILEGNDSLDEGLNDSLSDNENESKENVDESNLMERLEKMRQLFGMEEGESQTEIIPEKPKQSSKVAHVHLHSRRPTAWRYEKFIQLHKYSIIAGEMNLERRQISQKLFTELFGEDSDEEHEVEFSSAEKYRSSCTERISSWVVKYLMPFYNDKRILGRNVFKSLGHYISDTIVDEIQYPDEWTVKYFVSKFFPPKKKYICDADILNFQLD